MDIEGSLYVDSILLYFLVIVVQWYSGGIYHYQYIAVKDSKNILQPYIFTPDLETTQYETHTVFDCSPNLQCR